jgi:putative membrane protein
MRLDAVLAYLHYLAIFLTAFFLLLEWTRCRVPVDDRRARVLRRNDLAYGLSAMAALATGLLRLFYGVKGPAFYLANPAFHAKLGLYILVALLSIGPTLAYRRWSRGFAANAGYAVAESAVRRVRVFLLLQILLLLLIPAMAVMMARGLGF